MLAEPAALKLTLPLADLQQLERLEGRTLLTPPDPLPRYLNGEDRLGLGFEKEVRANGTTENKHYVSAGGTVFALFTSRSGPLNGLPASSTSYFNHDQLGSIAAITNEAGAVVERLAYDPWGKRRFINSQPGTPDSLDALVGQNTDRGYTMHEHLDEIGVVHMNGRIYDPLIGRMMSADPFIANPEDLQSYGRYTYVYNNPLVLTDPTGYWNPGRSLSHEWKGVWNSTAGRIAITVAVAYFTGIYDGGIFAGHAILNGAAAGFAAGFVGSGGDLQAGITGGITGAAFGWVGGVGLQGFEVVAAHAAVGCATTVISGGGCGPGAMAAGFSALAGGYMPKDWGVTATLIMRAVVGGTASVLGGGKFQNGAVTAAFGYLFNELLHSGPGAMQRAGYADAGYSRPYDPPLENVYPEGFLVGAGGAMKGGAGLVDLLKGVGGFFEGAAYTEKVLGQMSNARDLHHAFPLAVDAVAAQAGQITKIVGGDGATYFRLQAEGTVNGVKGMYEYIKNASGQINHRLFNTRP